MELPIGFIEWMQRAYTDAEKEQADKAMILFEKLPETFQLAALQEYYRDEKRVVVSVDYCDSETFFLSLSMIPFKELGVKGEYKTYNQALTAGLIEAGKIKPKQRR